MKKKMVSSLIILCTILSQGIASFSNYSSTDSLDLLFRKKRVIDRTPHADSRVQIKDVPYVVNILKNGNHVCAGSILSAAVILTAANCIETFGRYTAISGTVRTQRGIPHQVVGTLRHPSATPFSFVHNIALLSVTPPIRFGPKLNQPIEIYKTNGVIPASVPVTTSGWGLALGNHRGMACFSPGIARSRIFPSELRSITLHTLSTHDCRIRHNNDASITQHVVCTYHEDKFCGPGDNGNPLVFNNHLAGVMAWDGQENGRPDIFVNVAHPDYKTWIYQNMHSIPRRI